MFGKAFKTRSYYVFNYTPRYYNERKERLKKLEEKHSNNNDLDQDDLNVPHVDFSKSNLKQAWKRSKSSSNNRKTTLRLAIIITILVGIAAYILDFHHLV